MTKYSIILFFLFQSAFGDKLPCKNIQKVLSDYDVDSSKYTALLFYTPLNCINCNFPLARVFNKNNNKYRSVWGNNKFIIYPGIRENEVKDYGKNLVEIGNIDLRSINNRKLYDDILQLGNIKYTGKPMMLLFPPNSLTPVVFYFHDDADVLLRLDSLVADKDHH